jgi:hypothetical protein
LLRGVLPGGFVLGLLLVVVAEKFFWSTLAYLAILHFCRQQWGWVALSRRRAGESDAIGRAVDAFAVHAAFLVPLAWWHANPTPYGWFVPGDMFPVLPRGISPWLEGTFLASALCYFIFSCARWRAGFPLNPAKLGIVALTGATAWTGMVAFQRQEVFASLHLLCHGLPYLALVYAWGRGRFARDGTRSRVFPAPVFACAAAYYGTLLGVGVLWELSLDSFLRHPFPDLWEGGEFRPVTLLYLLGIPLLTLPQSAHFVLDGFFWKSGPRNDGLHGEIDAGLKAPDRQGT